MQTGVKSDSVASPYITSLPFTLLPLPPPHRIRLALPLHLDQVHLAALAPSLLLIATAATLSALPALLLLLLILAVIAAAAAALAPLAALLCMGDQAGGTGPAVEK